MQTALVKKDMNLELVDLLLKRVVEAEGRGKPPRDLGVGQRLPQRRDGRLVQREVQVAPRVREVEVLDLGEQAQAVGIIGIIEQVGSPVELHVQAMMAAILVAEGIIAAADRLLAQLEGEMLEAARALEFERAASLRDRIDDVRAAIAQAKGAIAPASTSGRIERIATPPRRMKRRFGKDR